MIDLTPARLIKDARDYTGLTDLGDPGFVDLLERFIDSLERESVLSEDGRDKARVRFERTLVNRLRFEHDRRVHPEITQERLAPPIFVMSLPRCGSTKLHRLLAEGQDFQSLLFWQLYHPAPFPDAVPGQPDPRIQAAVDYVTWRSGKSAAAHAGHYIEVFEPEEETYLVDLTLLTIWPAAYFEMPGFLKWIRGKDRNPVYAYLRELLKYSQWQFFHDNPRPYLLKAPPNIGYEQEIAHNLPGTRFLMLHRDPAEAITSLATLVREIRNLHCAQIPSYDVIFEWCLKDFGDAINRHVAWRKANPDAPVLDVAYRDICNNDMDVVRNVYKFLGLPFSQDAEARMQKWLGANPQHKYGERKYSNQATDIYVKRIRERFADYIAAYEQYF